MHEVAVLIMPGSSPFDLGIACDVFTHVRDVDGARAYQVRVCGDAACIDAGLFDVRPRFGLEILATADTIIVPGMDNPPAVFPPNVIDAIRSAAANGVRIASICSGAFVLAATGLLDGRRATTHWIGTADLALRHPAITVDPDVLFVDEGNIITSAGASAGLDMCLHLIRRDHGQAIAAHSARLAVAPLNREGGQAQFIRHEAPVSNASLAPLLEWMTINLDRPLNVDSLAVKACMSARTLARRFREQTGTTPVQWLLLARVRRAQELLETTALSVDRITTAAGFESPVTFRARFQRTVGVSPAAYRRRFNTQRAVNTEQYARSGR